MTVATGSYEKMETAESWLTDLGWLMIRGSYYTVQSEFSGYFFFSAAWDSSFCPLCTGTHQHFQALLTTKVPWNSPQSHRLLGPPGHTGLYWKGRAGDT